MPRPDTPGVITIPPLMLWLILGLLGYALVTSVFATLAARAYFETRRHDLIVKSKRMRLAYLNSLQEKLAGVLDDEHAEVIE